jgi:hypothetical protein
VVVYRFVIARSWPKTSVCILRLSLLFSGSTPVLAEKCHSLREHLVSPNNPKVLLIPSGGFSNGCAFSASTGGRAGWDGHKRRKGSEVHMAVDTLGQLLAIVVIPANEQDRAQVDELAKQIQEATGDSVEVAFVDQGYTGDKTAAAAKEHGIRLQVVKLPTVKRGFAAAAPLGRPTQLWLDGALPASGTRL